MEVKEVSIFKTKGTMKAMSKDSFKGGVPDIAGALPPIIADKEEAKAITDDSTSASNAVDMLNSGNFLLMLLIGGSMEQLWSLIRAVQMMILSGLVNIQIPINMFLYLKVCLLFAQMDIFKGEEIYEKNLKFKETEPLNAAFDFFGIGD